MPHHFLDIQALTKAFESLSGLTGLYYSIYDDRKNLLVTSTRQDALLTCIKTHKHGLQLYDEFMDKQFKINLRRKEPFMTQGPTGQHHIFMPLHYKNITLMVLAEAFYISPEDFKKFYMNHGMEFGLTEKDIDVWLKEVLIIPAERIEEIIQKIQSLIEILIANGYEKVELSKQWQWARIIISLLTSIKSDVFIKDIYQIIIDTVIFLFDVDTAAVFSQRNGFFHPEVSGGRNKDVIQKLSFSENNQFIVKATISKRPVSVMDSHELWHTGFPEEIISMYLFPIYSEFRFFGFLGIFNSLLDREAFDVLSEFCKLSGYICGARHLVEEYQKKSSELNIATLKTSQLYFLYKDPQQLYDCIVDEAASLADAEKCSLMLPVNEEDILSVSASKGINRWLMEDVRVRIGEGIAGRVYEQGNPILIDNENSLRSYVISPRPLFKTSSCLSLPLKIADEIIGILNLSDKHSGQPFSEEDLSILDPFVLQVSILLKLCFFYKTSEKMKELSITDYLTGLFNRRYFDIRIGEEFQRAKRHKLLFSLAIIDVDDFKLFNDTEGHLAGDHILREIASIISGIIRVNDTLVRFGGEEFALIIPQTSKIETFHMADRIRKKIKDQIIPTWKKFPREHITVSIGIAMYPDCGEPVENLIRCADRALYKAKMQGKDQTVSFE